MQDDKSIADQQRECHERASRDGLVIEPGFQFVDNAVSGTKLRRAGLDRLLAAAKRRDFQVLYFHSLSRLARESVITMPMLKELAHVHRVRVVSLTENIDTGRQGWEINAIFTSLHHEQFIKDLSANVLRGQVGTVLARFSTGDYRFGYTSVPSPGGEVIGRGRNAKPRMIYAIDPDQAEWVRRIFEWFVVDRQPLNWIVRELNQRKIPKDHRSTTTKWHRSLVVRVLRSPKYIGQWSWGLLKNSRNPLTGQVSQEQRSDEETLPWLREFPELRIIEDETYAEAQRHLDQNDQTCGRFRSSGGRLSGSPKGNGRQHLLSGLVQCGGCGSRLYVSGSRGKYLLCPGARDGICGCRTQLPRDLAERLILEAIGQLVLADQPWQEAAFQSLSKSWQELVTARPDEVQEVSKQFHDCERRIGRLVDQVEDSEVPNPELKQRLAERRAERIDLTRRLERVKSPPSSLQTPPTREWAEQQLARLGDVLRSGTPAAGEALRNLLDGPVRVEEIPVENRKRRFWRAKLVVEIGRLTTVTVPGLSIASDEPNNGTLLTQTITLEMRQPTKTERQGDAAWPLFEQGLQCQEIAQRLGISKSRITVILQAAAAKRGIASLDGQLREAAWARKPKRSDVARDEVLRLLNEGLLMYEIAERVNLNQGIVRRIVVASYRDQGQPVPDGRHRRKTLPTKSHPSSGTRRISGGDDCPGSA